jgi:hypothetical protein
MRRDSNENDQAPIDEFQDALFVLQAIIEVISIVHSNYLKYLEMKIIYLFQVELNNAKALHIP